MHFKIKAGEIAYIYTTVKAAANTMQYLKYVGWNVKSTLIILFCRQ